MEGSGAATYCLSEAADTDAEEEAIHERIRPLEKKKQRTELLRHQKELEDEVRSSTVDMAKGEVAAGELSLRIQVSAASLASLFLCHTRRGTDTKQQRRARSKWSVKRFMEERKDIKKMIPFELIEASCAWVVDKKDADEESLIGFIKHIGYMAGKAKSGRFVDAAHINYDLAVRKLAVSDGYKAFTAGNPELALKYYAFEYMKKPSSTTSIQSQARPTRNCLSKMARSHALTTTGIKAVAGMRRHEITGTGAPVAAAVHIPARAATRNELLGRSGQLTMFVTPMHPLISICYTSPLYMTVCLTARLLTVLVI